MHLAAERSECAALARRFGLAALDSLEADAVCIKDAVAISVEGRLTARLTQNCVATGEPIPVALDEPFALRFVPAQELEINTEEIELSATDCDVIPYADGVFDLGEAVAETLLLALDPFPRCADADAKLKAAGVLSEDQTSPFAVLKDLLGNKS